MNYLINIFSIIKLSGLMTLVSVLLISYPAFSAEEEHDDHEEEHVEISAELAQELGIRTQVAGSGEIIRTLLLYGKTMPDPQQVSHVAARYPGMIASIKPRLGDSVNANDVIAVIESNESLRSYDIKAPISGIVIEKHANPGELAGNNSLLTIANYDNVWVDLTVFPGEARQIKPGLPVTIKMDGLTAISTIRYLNPTEGNSPVVIARVPLENPDLIWTPGLLVEGHVEIEKVNVDLVVDNRALQTLEDETVVFVVNGDEYEPHPIVIGRSNEKFTEVLEGLTSGDTYVVENSYLIKADLEKDGVEHDH